jgi:hypothetical protein
VDYFENFKFMGLGKRYPHRSQLLVVAWCGTTNWWRAVRWNKKVGVDDWRHNYLVAACGVDIDRNGMSQLSGTINWWPRLG